MKKGVKVILSVTFVFLFALIMASCGSVEAISVSESDDYQTVYVRGQDLNLSGGILIIDEDEKISLDSKDISVSGYNKDTLGKQTVTIEYKGAKTEITVTVVERLVVNGAITNYIVGDNFDRSRGSVTITSDDGTSKTISFSDASISVSGFNSDDDKIGADIKVVYNSDGVNYEGALTVNVYPIESVDFRRPNKISYGSHYEGDVDVAGGKLIITGNGGEIKREIAITADMVTGLDVSAVSPSNSSTTQKLTVTYQGMTYYYDVNVTYTGISMFLDNKDAFDKVNWKGDDEPVIDQELGDIAIQLMESYFDMSKTDQAVIDSEYLFNVARTAMVYGFDLWGENIRLFKGVFAIEYGETVLYLENYEKVKAALDLFDDEDSAIYTIAPLLVDIIELYGDEVVYENSTTCIRFSSYPVMNEYDLSVMEAMLEHTLDVYDFISTVPDDWNAENITNYSGALESAIHEMFSELYIAEYPDIYYFVSDWRENGDLFDMLYSYLYATDPTDQRSYIQLLSYYGLPSKIGVLYGYLLNAISGMEQLQNAKVFDTTSVFYNYYLASDLANEIKASGSTMENYVYSNIPLNYILGATDTEIIDFEMLFEYVRTAAYGYNYLSSGLLGIEEYDVLMREYVALVDKLTEIEGYENSEGYENDIKSIFDKFVALSPTQQYNFIASLNSLYVYGLPELAFDTADEYTGQSSLFSVMINSFMRSKLSDTFDEAYNNLILAIEVFANRVGYDEWETDFTSRMNKVAEALEGISGEDEVNFNHYLSGAYNKYKKIQTMIGQSVDLGAWEDEFNSLHQALNDMQTAYYHVSSNQSGNYNYFFASFERASQISEYIKNNAPENIVNAYYYEFMFELESGSSSEEAIFASYEYVVAVYRNFYIDYLVYFGSDMTNIYDAYCEKQLGEFLALYYDMVSAFVNKEEGQEKVFDDDKIIAVINAFCNLDSASKALFEVMEGQVDIYYTALNLFIDESFSDNAANVAKKLFSLEKLHYSYEVTQSAVTLNSIREILDQLKELHKDLVGEDETSFAVLEDIYGYYVDKCEKLFA